MRTRILVAPVIALFAVAPSIAVAQKAEAKGKGGAAAAPFAAVIASERAAWENVKLKDGAKFDATLGLAAGPMVNVDVNGISKMAAGDLAKMLQTCALKSYTLSDVATSGVGADVAVVTYTSTFDMTCDGKRMPSPVAALSVWQKKGGSWIAVAHSETALAGAK
jgi:hypothetical protein